MSLFGQVMSLVPVSALHDTDDIVNNTTAFIWASTSEIRCNKTSWPYDTWCHCWCHMTLWAPALESNGATSMPPLNLLG